MAEAPKAVTWEAPEHHHFEPGTDWYWYLGIGTITLAAAIFFFGNFLFALLIIIAGIAAAIAAIQPVEVIPFAVTLRGVRLNNTLYPYSTLESYYINEEGDVGPELLLKTQHLFSPLLILPIPEEYQDEIEYILEQKLPEEHLEESIFVKLLEIFGF